VGGTIEGHCTTALFLKEDTNFQRRYVTIKSDKEVSVVILQVILHPGSSTSGRSDQQRLFLRKPDIGILSSAFVWTIPPFVSVDVWKTT